MAFLEWTSDLNTGIGLIDDQHKVLVDYINRMHDANLQGEKKVVGEVLQGLIDYTVKHFSEEEEMMRKAGYELVDLHAQIHTKFVDKIAQFQSQFRNGQEVMGELLALLERWLFMHIRVNDGGYVSTMKAAGL